jgi:anhydro-N-acetylmuramic acid kinase
MATRLSEIVAARSRVVAGLMTGTSMDGLDVAICRIEAGLPIRFELLAATTVPMPAALAGTLGRILELRTPELARLDRALGEWFADAVLALAEEHGLRPDLMGSHGQTVYHEHGHITLQLGEPAFMAERLGCPVVSDFRRNDIAAGGCGAPLAPFLDKWLLGRPDEGVLALNIGGIANFTAVPPREAGDLPVIGLDCGPGNMVLDELARRWTQGREQADIDGRTASRGEVDEDLLRELLRHPFFAAPLPRTAGREQFGRHYVDRLLERAAPPGDRPWHDLFATVTELTVAAVADAAARFVPESYRIGSVVVSGGGARNLELMRRLRARLPGCSVETSDAHGLPVDFKESILFAVLASLRLDGVPTNLPEVTGASRPVLLGKITES